MKLPDLTFKTKALLLLGGLQLGGLLVLGFLSYDQSQDVLRRLAEDQFRLATEQVSREVTDYVRGESQMLLLLTRMTPLQSALQMRDSADSYAQGQALYEMWIKQIERSFLDMAALRPQCLDLVYVDDGGRELVHIHSDEGVSTALAPDELAGRADAPICARPPRWPRARSTSHPPGKIAPTCGWPPPFSIPGRRGPDIQQPLAGHKPQLAADIVDAKNRQTACASVPLQQCSAHRFLSLHGSYAV